MSHKTAATVAHTIGIDTGKNTLHLIGLDDIANVPRCLNLNRSWHGDALCGSRAKCWGQSFCGRRLHAAGSQPGSVRCPSNRSSSRLRASGPIFVSA